MMTIKTSVKTIVLVSAIFIIQLKNSKKIGINIKDNDKTIECR